MQNKRAIIFLGLAALCGLATANAARNFGGDSAPALDTVPVVVATEAAALGTAADGKATVVAWPKATVPQGAFQSTNGLADRVLARSIVKGEPILESALLPEGAEAGLDALIPKRLRAVSIEIDEFIGVSGFVQPGSRVDVLATLRSRGEGGGSVTSVALDNVPVLAVDSRVERNEGGADREVRVVTLEVTPTQARTLTHAEDQGNIKLALRNPGDNDDARPVELVLGTEVY
jgi:pilus assembly protein CpaB